MVITYRWAWLQWSGIPEPIRIHVARSAGRSKRLDLAGCGCTLAGKRLYRELQDAEQTAADVLQMAADLGARLWAAGLSLWLTAAPPTNRLRALLAIAITAAKQAAVADQPVEVAVAPTNNDLVAAARARRDQYLAQQGRAPAPRLPQGPGLPTPAASRSADTASQVPPPSSVA